MSGLGRETLTAPRYVWDLLQGAVRAHGEMTGALPRLGPVRFEERPSTTEINSLAPSGSMTLARAISRTTPLGPGERIEVMLGPAERTIDPFRWFAHWRTWQPAERAPFWGSPPSTRTIPETITPAAEKYARALGLYGSLVVTKEIVRETLPSMGALHIDVKKDPDEGGHSTICFAVTIRESVDCVLELDDALQDALYDRVSAPARLYLSFTYQFE